MLPSVFSLIAGYGVHPTLIEMVIGIRDQLITIL